MKAPNWNLGRVQEVAALPNGVFVQMGKKTSDAFGGSRKAATNTARDTILALTVRSFAEKKVQTWDVCDVYAVKAADGSGWYLKIALDENIPEVAVVSFHPLDFPMKTNGGTVKP